MNMRNHTVPMASSLLAIARRSLGAVLLLTGLAASGGVQAGGDVDAGQEKSATCAACHGAQGIGEITTYPILAGQYESYLAHALKSYRDGSRENAIMAGFAATLSDQDIADLAAFFAAQSGPLKTASSD